MHFEINKTIKNIIFLISNIEKLLKKKLNHIFAKKNFILNRSKILQIKACAATLTTSSVASRENFR